MYDVASWAISLTQVDAFGIQAAVKGVVVKLANVSVGGSSLGRGLLVPLGCCYTGFTREHPVVHVSIALCLRLPGWIGPKGQRCLLNTGLKKMV